MIVFRFLYLLLFFTFIYNKPDSYEYLLSLINVIGNTQMRHLAIAIALL